MTEDADSKETRDKEKEYKFLKPGKGTGPTPGATVAVFDRKTAAKDIVDFWKSELEKAIEKEKGAKK